MDLVGNAKLLYGLARAAPIMLCGRTLIVEDAALHHGPFSLHPWSVEMRSGRVKRFGSYNVLIGRIDTPLHVPLRLEQPSNGDAARGDDPIAPLRMALAAHGVVSVGEIPIGGASRDELLSHIRRERALFDQMSAEFAVPLPAIVAARLSAGEVERAESARRRAGDRIARERRVIDDAVRALDEE